MSELYLSKKIKNAISSALQLLTEVRCGNDAVVEAVCGLEDEATRCAVTAERSMLSALGGGCRVPIGAWARSVRENLVLEGVVAAPDGSRLLRGRVDGPPERARQIGGELAGELLARGGDAILRDVDP